LKSIVVTPARKSELDLLPTYLVLRVQAIYRGLKSRKHVK
jgi:hypothetical protein